MDSLKSDDVILEIIRCQNSILEVDPPESNKQKVLHYIHKLSRLPIKLHELELTGIGKNLNALRQVPGNIGEEATLLVVKWKSIVTKQFLEEDAAFENESTDFSPHSSPKSEKPDKKVHMIRIKKRDSSEQNRSREQEASDPKRSIEQDLGARKRRSSDNKKHSVQSKFIKTERKDTDELVKLDIQSETKNDTKKNDIFKKLGDYLKEYNDIENNKSVFKDETVNYNEKKQSYSDSYTSQQSDKKRSDPDPSYSRKHERTKRNVNCKPEKMDSSSRSLKHERDKDTKILRESEKRSKNKKHKNKDDERNRKCRNDRQSKKDKRNLHPKVHSASPSVCHSAKKGHQSEKEAIGTKEFDNDQGDFGAALLGIPVVSAFKKKLPSHSPSISPSRSYESIGSFEAPLELDTNELSEDLVDSNLGSPTHTAVLDRKIKKSDDACNNDTFNLMITSKSQKTKVFSGNKMHIQYTQCPSLFELCTRILQDNFDALEFTGGVPYEVLKNILEKVSAQQLFNFENYNPYLIGDTEELWEYHANRDFRKSTRLEDETWRDFYLRCFEEREEKFQSLTVNITQNIANSAPVRKTKLAYIDTAVKPPRNIARTQAKFGTGNVSANSELQSKDAKTSTQSVKDRLLQESLAVHIPSKADSFVKKKKAPLMLKTLQFMKKGMKR